MNQASADSPRTSACRNASWGSTREGVVKSMTSADRMTRNGMPAPLFTRRMTPGSLPGRDSVPSSKMKTGSPPRGCCEVERKLRPLNSSLHLHRRARGKNSIKLSSGLYFHTPFQMKSQTKEKVPSL